MHEALRCECMQGAGGVCGLLGTLEAAEAAAASGAASAASWGRKLVAGLEDSEAVVRRSALALLVQSMCFVCR